MLRQSLPEDDDDDDGMESVSVEEDLDEFKINQNDLIEENSFLLVSDLTLTLTL